MYVCVNVRGYTYRLTSEHIYMYLHMHKQTNRPWEKWYGLGNQRTIGYFLYDNASKTKKVLFANV